MRQITVYEAEDGSLWHCKSDAKARDEQVTVHKVNEAKAKVLEIALNAEDSAVPLLHTLQKMGYTLRRRSRLKKGDYLINGSRRSIYDPVGYSIVEGDNSLEDCKKCCFAKKPPCRECNNRPDGRVGYFRQCV
jgi:hypothetical protein